MAAYQKPGFVVAIVRDGQIIREMSEDSERVVRLPFGSEYSIRLINKTDKRAYATIKVDGTAILNGKLVLAPKNKIDVERFMLDGDMERGKRLKFVSADSSDEVQDPTSADNGLVEVTFEPEAEDYMEHLGGLLRGALRGTGSTISATSLSAASSCATNSAQFKTDTMTHVSNDVGATVGGKTSTQGFQYVNTFFPTDKEVVIGVRLKGLKEKPVLGHGRKTYVLTSNQDGKLIVDVNGTIVGGVESVEITGTHLVLKVPMDQVQIGWTKT